MVNKGSSIVIVYHRAPYDDSLKVADQKFQPRNESPNGIIPLLKSFFSSTSDSIWIASGESEATQHSDTKVPFYFFNDQSSCLVRKVGLSKEEIRLFYHQTSKEAFWPVLHSFLDKYNSQAVDWQNFERINRLFAKAACEEADEEAVIWIHDYNLWLVPYFIRKERPNSRIAFFLHTPFPSPDIFNVLPWRKQIIESLLSCDLLGFAIPRYVENFVSTAKSICSVEIQKSEPVDSNYSVRGIALSEAMVTTQLTYKERSLRLGAFPVGTDYSFINNILSKPNFLQKVESLKLDKRGSKIILAASRADYIKGTLQLLKCYQRLLKSDSDLRGKITLCIISVQPAEGISAYDDLQREVEAQIKCINQQYSLFNWCPIFHYFNAFSFDEMVAWYTATDIMWIPSLRDGMNLVCKEFVAAKKGEAGVLVLSEFAGAAVELEGAVLTNPYSDMSMDDSIKYALQMGEEEQKRRMKSMYKKVIHSDPINWAKQIKCLQSSVLID